MEAPHSIPEFIGQIVIMTAAFITALYWVAGAIKFINRLSHKFGKIKKVIQDEDNNVEED